jgi:hypothetical protein
MFCKTLNRLTYFSLYSFEKNKNYMNIFSWRYVAFLSFLSFVFVATSCKDDEPAPPVVTVADFEVTIDETPESNTSLGTLQASTDKGTLAFTLQSESVSGAFAVNATTGALSVLDGSKFDFETDPVLTAVVLVKNGGVESNIDVKVNLQKIIWTGANLTFTKAHGSDWKLAANQDKITAKVILTRQSKGPIYNYQWWQTAFSSDATFTDLNDDFWNSTSSEREFTREGGTKGIRWAILDDTGLTNEMWDNFKLYGTLGDPTHFYSLHNIASIIPTVEGGTNVVGIPDNFGIQYEGGDINENSGTEMPSLVGKKLGVWLVEEDIYFTLTFTSWGADGDNSISYTRSTKD